MGIPDDAVIATYPDGLDGSEPFAVCWHHLLPAGALCRSWGNGTPYLAPGARRPKSGAAVARPVLVDIPKPLVVTFPDGQTLPLEVLDRAMRYNYADHGRLWCADLADNPGQPTHAARRDVYAAIDAQAVKP